MKNDCIMPLGSLINKLLRGEADEWCETDFGFYLESLTHGDKKELEQHSLSSSAYMSNTSA